MRRHATYPISDVIMPSRCGHGRQSEVHCVVKHRMNIVSDMLGMTWYAWFPGDANAPLPDLTTRSQRAACRRL